MAIEQIDINDFIKLSQERPVLDVRSPAEYLHAHIPGAFSLPLFTDEQRKFIGTAYKQQSRQVAVKIGLGYFSHRMEAILSDAEEKIINQAKKGSEDNHVLVHCWRGGMRSRSVAWLLDLYGYKVYTLKGGYKAFRNWVLEQFEKTHSLKIMGGYTGSGKTMVLQEMKKQGAIVIDLEKIANHKGSAFGSIGEAPQPSQEMFENFLAIEFFKTSFKTGGDLKNEIWLEDESRHIGSVGIPKTLWNNMRESPLYFLEIPFKERLDYIISTYGTFEKNQLINSIEKIQKRLGGLETRNAINYLLDNKVNECFSILLHYYDKLYTTALYKRENIHDLLNKISCKTVDTRNAEKLDQVSC